MILCDAVPPLTNSPESAVDKSVRKFCPRVVLFVRGQTCGQLWEKYFNVFSFLKIFLLPIFCANGKLFTFPVDGSVAFLPGSLDQQGAGRLG